MNLKKIKIIAVIGIFLLCFFTHFLYTWFPNPFFALFFPVNESIWEHMKMLFTTILLYGGIDYLLIKKFHIAYANFTTQLVCTAIISIPIYLFLFLPIYYWIGEKMWISLFILFISLIITQKISYILLSIRPLKYMEYLAIWFIIISYCLFGYLTYHPIENDIFWDPIEEKYGIYIFQI